MERKIYKILGNFERHGKNIVVAGIGKRAACTMPLSEYKRIINTQNKQKGVVVMKNTKILELLNNGENEEV